MNHAGTRLAALLAWATLSGWVIAQETPGSAMREAAAPEAAETATSAEPASSVDVTREGDLYSLKAVNAPLSEILDQLKAKSEINLEVDPALLHERLTINLSGLSYEKVLEVLAGSQVLVYERDSDGSYRLISARITSRQDYIAPKLDDLSRKERRTVKQLSAKVRQLRDEHGQIIQYAGELDYDQAKALVSERKARSQAIVDALAALGPGGARAMLGVYGEEESGTREKLAMIEALGRVNDPDAAKVLGSLFGTEDTYSLRREIVAALGARSEPDVIEVLSSIMSSEDDVRLRAASVQAMAGRSEALDELTAVVDSPTEKGDVRKEAVRSLGEIKSADAMNQLARISMDANESGLQKAAIQELGRTYGAAAMPAFEVLMQSPSDAVRNNTVKAVARVEGDQSTALLKAAATNDVSEVVRAQAAAELGRRGVSLETMTQ